MPYNIPAYTEFFLAVGTRKVFLSNTLLLRLLYILSITHFHMLHCVYFINNIRLAEITI